ncbi:MOSC domain-containing protein [Aspergillus chevalieri]|uniref:MOSC domain-containing protein n=1 Tax=Aspergillus chevalieri TaxID=182096 RepID=A0A7R7ZKW0_ASPCH|nr:uncharacterized protein ACHE_20199S [Aspergillus chevalieri]BCR84741.1 hypothetical protein ACHE_20199S [Aspergillus chevalieri]
MLLQLVQSLQGLNAATVLYFGITAALLLSLGFAAIVQNGNTSKTRRSLRNLRRFGLSTGNSNMTDQYSPKYAIPEDIPTNGPIRIKSIYIHPVKSCGPIELNRALLTKTGFMYDRCFAIAAETDGKWRFISQRTKPGMALIETELWLPHEGSDSSDVLVKAAGCVVLRFRDPDVPDWTKRLEMFLHTGDFFATPEVSIVVPLQPVGELKPKTFNIHRRDTNGLDMGQIPSVAVALPKLKRFLEIPEKQPFTLLRCTPESLLRTDLNLAPLDYIGSPAVHGYTDQQPVNINSLSSVHAVSTLLPKENQPLNALRFRANLWVTGAPAYAEESWKRYRILPKSGNTEPRADVAPALSVVCRTSRCTMPNVNPDTGRFDADMPPPGKKKGKPQPSTTLVEYRTIETGNKAALGYLGMHCVPEDRDFREAEEQGEGLYVEVGDEIEVLETGVHVFGSTGNDY